MTYETIVYEVDGPVATITLHRPQARNAQNSTMIDEIDAAFTEAERNADVRVVVLAAAGDHFSAGHDLKEILEGTSEWAQKRATAEGKLEHETVMYWDKCLRIRDFPKPTIAAVQGACAAAGLMLACMCDLIVAADDAKFSNPVLRMTGVGVELLVEPWEFGARKAKEFLLCAQSIDAQEAWRLGMVNKVVPRAELASTAREMAETVALVPPITASAIKDTINHTLDSMGQREAWKYHFQVHQDVSNSDEAKAALAERQKGGMEHVKREQGRAREGAETES